MYKFPYNFGYNKLYSFAFAKNPNLASSLFHNPVQ